MNIDTEIIAIGITLLSPIYGMMLYLTVQSVKVTQIIKDCKACQKALGHND